MAKKKDKENKKTHSLMMKHSLHQWAMDYGDDNGFGGFSGLVQRLVIQFKKGIENGETGKGI